MTDRDVDAAVARLQKADRKEAEDSWDEIHDDILVVCAVLADMRRQFVAEREQHELAKNVLGELLSKLAKQAQQLTLAKVVSSQLVEAERQLARQAEEIAWNRKEGD